MEGDIACLHLFYIIICLGRMVPLKLTNIKSLASILEFISSFVCY